MAVGVVRVEFQGLFVGASPPGEVLTGLVVEVTEVILRIGVTRVELYSLPL